MNAPFRRIRRRHSLAFRWIVSALAWGPWRADHADAQDQNVAGNLSVAGTANVEGDSLLLGTPAGLPGQPGVTLHYGDGSPSSAPDQIAFTAVRPQASWMWLYTASGGGVQPQMWLDDTNTLTIYDRAATPGGAIQLSPSATSLFSQSLLVNGTDSRMPNQTLADPSSLLTAALADGRYLSLAAAAGYLTQGAADDRYLPNNATSGIAVGTMSSYWQLLPTLALPGGTATGPGSIAGVKATASAYYAVALGSRSSASAYWAMALDSGATATGEQSIAVGFNSLASNLSAAALGTRTVASGFCSTATGYSAVASGTCAVASGTGSTASGGYAVAIGYDSKAIGPFSMATGYESRAGVTFAIASAPFAVASGDRSTASGYASVASGDTAVASGFQSAASGRFSEAAGANTIAAGSGQFVVGQYNSPQGDPTFWFGGDDLVQVGNGTDATHRSNAFTIKKNGDTTVAGTLTTAKLVASHVDPQGDLSMGSFTTGQ
jgi:hypothetical protein